jgi:4-carboxymuconolactone decarboxylase
MPNPNTVMVMRKMEAMAMVSRVRMLMQNQDFYDTSLSDAHAELAILVTARHWTAHFEWYAHKRFALNAGLDPAIIEDIKNRRTPTFGETKERVIYDVAKSLHEAQGLSKALYDDAVEVLGAKTLAEIIGLCGYYTMVSMTLNTYEFGLPDGQVSELA